MNDDPELRRSKIAVRLNWLQESGVALPADLAEMAESWADEQRGQEVTTNRAPSMKERVHSSDDATEVAELLIANRQDGPDTWFVFEVGDHVAGWLEKHPDQAIPLFQALVERGTPGEGLASRVVAWLSDRADYLKVLSCLSILAGSGRTDFDEYLISSAARALRVLADSSELDDRHEFWPIWSFMVDIAASSSKPIQAHENDPLTDSLNAPGGYLAEAFILKAYQKETERVSGSSFRERLKALAIGDRDFHFLARTMLASRLPWLHAMDREWAGDVLIARMGWSGLEPTSEARALWQGYLWAPRLNPKLLADLKPAFLQALRCDLGFRGENNLHHLFADLLLKAPDKLSPDETQSAFRDMPVDGLVACARYWQQILKGTSENAATIWQEKVGPLIQRHWPFIAKKRTSKTVEALALLAAETKEAFPDAFATLSEKILLEPLAKSGFILRSLADTKPYDYATNHPQETVKLISQAVDLHSRPFDRGELRAILKRALESDATVEQSAEYYRLNQRLMS